MRLHYIGLLILLFSQGIYAQNKFTLSGNIKDEFNGEDLIGVTILVKELPGTGTVANVYGFYSLTLPEGIYTIQYRYIGYRTQEFSMNFNKDLKKDIELVENTEELKVFEVSAEKDDENIRSTEMGVTKINL